MRIAVGTRKGVWIGDDATGEWRFDGPHLGAAEVASVAWLPDGSVLAGTLSFFWGVTLHRSNDLGTTWHEVAPGIAFDADDGAALERVWHLQPDPYREGVVWAGCEPTSLWRSDDGGHTFALVRGLWDHPHRPDWLPGQGGAAIHTVVPRPDGSLYVAMSTGGVYRSSDEGLSWTPASRGIEADFLPDAFPEYGQCVHRLAMDAQDPDLMFVQNHGGVYRTRDGGQWWERVDSTLPADFGFVALTHPSEGGTAWVMPVDAADGRVPVGGELRLHRTIDAGDTWEPCQGAATSWNSVLRDAAHATARTDGTACVAFGTRDGCVYVSTDDGVTFVEVARHLSDVLSVRVSR